MALNPVLVTLWSLTKVTVIHLVVDETVSGDVRSQVFSITALSGPPSLTCHNTEKKSNDSYKSSFLVKANRIAKKDRLIMNDVSCSCN